MPLAMVEKGTDYTIKRISGNDETRHHLGNLGFVIGATLSVVTEMNGNVIVNIKDSRVAISRSMATKIFV